MKILYVSFLISLSTWVLTLVGCLADGTTPDGGTKYVTTPSSGAISPNADPNRTICDPFKTNSPQARDRGLVANLFYLKDDSPSHNNLTDFINNSILAPVTVYLDRLYVPTLHLDHDFNLESGDVLTKPDGSSLGEYFGLHIAGKLKLTANESAGKYQLALMADDGAVLKIPDGFGSESILVNNDGHHPTQFMCANEPVEFNHATQLPFHIDYYQGAGRHVSLIAMWRPWPEGGVENNPIDDPMCGRHGNGLFFHPEKADDENKDDEMKNNEVRIKLPFFQLLDRGWKVLENENYVFPDQANNPCVPVEEKLTISNVFANSIARDGATITWDSNIPANTQGDTILASTSVDTPSAIDPNLVTSHILTFTGLLPNTLYAYTVTSISAAGQKATSDLRTFRTTR